MNTDTSECLESSTLTFEWTLRGLKNMFESTQGDKKSKVLKSVPFGNGRWQILFYANAGQTKEGSDDGFVSLYISCEPTADERERALADMRGRWARDGVYKFSFELRSLEKVLYNGKEAQDHTFSYKTANWGWAQFAKRNDVYYHSLHAKSQDAFIIICSLTATSSHPQSVSPYCQLVPKELLDSFGSLLDDPLYSDVQFIIPKRGQNLENSKTIWASKKLLQRFEYFQHMFNSNFAEGSIGHEGMHFARSPGTNPSQKIILDEFEDSDNEDDFDTQRQIPDSSGMEFLSDANATDSDIGNQLKDIHFRSTERGSYLKDNERNALLLTSTKSSVVVRDVAYLTYRSVLYYIYTNNIVFAPLSSSFSSQTRESETSCYAAEIGSSPSSEDSQLSTANYPSSRGEWIRMWMRANPGRPAPCSAKSIYRVADRLDLSELKKRASQHILKSLTIENVAYEIFSPFAAAFEAIRKVEVEFFLAHWHEIRNSEMMQKVFSQLRNGKHPGFEEVWPVIAQRLEFNAATSSPRETSIKRDEYST